MKKNNEDTPSDEEIIQKIIQRPLPSDALEEPGEISPLLDETLKAIEKITRPQIKRK